MRSGDMPTHKRIEKLDAEVRRIRNEMEHRGAAKVLPSNTVLQSKRFELVDEDGNIRLILEMHAGDPALRFVDEEGRCAAFFRFKGGELHREAPPPVEESPHSDSPPSREADAAPAAVEKPEKKVEAPPLPLEDRVAALHPWFHPLKVRDIAVVPGIGSTMSAVAIENQSACRATLLVDAVANRYAIDGKSVLDLGCGDGFWSARYAEKGANRVLGVDGRRLFVEQASLYFGESALLPRKAWRFLEGDVTMPAVWEEIRSASPFDVGLVAGLLHHIPNYREVLAWTADVVREAIVIDTRVGDAEERVVEEPGDLLYNAMGDSRAKVVPFLPHLLDCLRSLGFEPEVLPVGFPSGPGVQHGDSYESERRVAIFARRKA